MKRISRERHHALTGMLRGFWPSVRVRSNGNSLPLDRRGVYTQVKSHPTRSPPHRDRRRDSSCLCPRHGSAQGLRRGSSLSELGSGTRGRAISQADFLGGNDRSEARPRPSRPSHVRDDPAASAQARHEHQDRKTALSVSAGPQFPHLSHQGAGLDTLQGPWGLASPSPGRRAPSFSS